PCVSRSATVRSRVWTAQIAQRGWVGVGMGRVCRSRTYVSGTRCVEFVPDLRRPRANRQPPAAVHVSLATGPHANCEAGPWGTYQLAHAPDVNCPRSHPPPMPTTPEGPPDGTARTGCGPT